MSKNPFQCRAPVIGDDFYGRHDIISDILDDDRVSHTWVIGNRRSGKTSLLRQLEYLVSQDTFYSERYIPVFWDMQGITDTEGLQERLVEGLWDLKRYSSEKFDLLNIDLEAIENLRIKDILKKIGRSIENKYAWLLLLCDEVEMLIDIAKKDGHVISILRKYFQEGWTRTVITATGALWNLTEKDKMVSPFLSGFIPPKHTLGPLSKKDALALIKRENSIPDSWTEKICRITNQMPYYIQLICMEIHDSQFTDVDEAIEKTVQSQNLGVILENDLNGLNIVEKVTLLCIVENSKISLNDLKEKVRTELHSDFDPKDLDLVENLNRLGYIKQKNRCFEIPNIFLQIWYKKNLRQIVSADYHQLAQDPSILFQFEELRSTYDKRAVVYTQKISEQFEDQLEKKTAQLLMAGRMATLNAMATSLAHQINNPLQIIHTIIYDLKKQIENEELKQEILAIATQADRINNLITHFRSLVKDESSAYKYVDINEIVYDAFMQNFKQQLKNRGIKIDLSTMGDELSSIYANRIKLEQIFINLIANARDALEDKEDPTITVKTYQQNDKEVVIEFFDNGRGIAAEDINRIFEPLFTTKDHGTGLGLWLCYNIIQQMGGTIEVKSKMRLGTTFIITLPIKGA